MIAPRILLTGGTGKTGRRLARQLAERGIAARVASRSGAAPDGQQGIRFDWADASTYAGAIEGIDSIYLVAPANAGEVLDAMTPFLEQALAAGIKRFVLLSASSLQEGGPMMGAVHAYLRAHAPEWAVLRPTWFMQNFSELQHLATIRDESRIYSATADGKVPFVDAGDIAAVASQALTQEVPLNRDVIITGPEALSYGAVAAILSTQTGRAITHERLTPAALADRFAAAGMPEAYAKMLAAMDDAIASGSEDRTTTEVEQLTGRAPLSFSTFATMAGSVWQRQG